MKNKNIFSITSIISVASLYIYFLTYDMVTNATLKWLRDIAFFLLVGLDLANTLYEKKNTEKTLEFSHFIVPCSALGAFLLFQLRVFLDFPTRSGVPIEASPIPKIRDFLLVLVVLFTLISLIFATLLFLSKQSERVQTEIGKDKRTLLQNTFLNFLYIAPILVLVNYITVQRNYSFDLSSIGKFSYSETSRSILKQIDREISITAFYPRPLEASSKEESWSLSAIRPDVEIYLENLTSINSKIKIKFINADVETDLMGDFPGVSNGTILVRSLKQGSKIDGNPYIEERVLVQTKKDLEDLERKIVQSINNVTLPPRKVYITVQNGERFGQNFAGNVSEQTAKLTQAFNFFNFSVKGLTYQEGWPKIPEDTDLLVILGPTVPYSEEARQSIWEYIEKRNGNLLITIDPYGQEKLEWLLEKSNLQFQYANLRQIEGKAELIATNFPDHPVHSNINRKELGVVFPYSGYFEKITTRTDSILEDSNLLESGFTVFIDKNKNEKRDPDESNSNFIFGSVLQLKKSSNENSESSRGKILLFAGTSWITDRYFLYNLNPVLFTNCINWVFSNPTIASILPKKEEVPTITLTSGQKVVIWSVGLFGFPGTIIAVLSFYVANRRRRRSL
jgi:hypothetical protein